MGFNFRSSIVYTAEWAGWDGFCQVIPLWQNQPQTIGCLVLEARGSCES